jgi:hypothetical protein
MKSMPFGIKVGLVSDFCHPTEFESPTTFLASLTRNALLENMVVERELFCFRGLDGAEVKVLLDK